MDEDGGQEWCLIESDPGVFTEMLKSLGVEDVVVEEVYDLGGSSFKNLQSTRYNVFGFVFLFKWSSEVEKNDKRPISDFSSSDLVFMKQVAGNACATQAILSIILNNKNVKIGENLSAVKEFALSSNSNPYMAGMAISCNEVIRNAHNSFAPPPSAFQYASGGTGNADAFHYVGYIYHEGNVIELDGLREGPVLVKSCNYDDWMTVMRDAVMERVQRLQGGADAENEIRFNLLAVISDPLVTARNELIENRRSMQRISLKLICNGAEACLDDDLDEDTDSSSGVFSLDELPDEIGTLQEMQESYKSRIQVINDLISSEEHKREKWRKENIRRRHDFVPLLLCILRHLARRHELKGALLNTLNGSLAQPVVETFEKRDSSI